MQLSKFSDYSFRALVYLGNRSDTLCTVEALAQDLETSSHHMKKVVHKLAALSAFTREFSNYTLQDIT